MSFCLFLQQGTYYTQPLYAAPPHVIHHTTVVQPNGMPATMYPAPLPPPRGSGMTMGMVAGTTMAMSAGTFTSFHPIFCVNWSGGKVNLSQKKQPLRPLSNWGESCVSGKAPPISLLYLAAYGPLWIYSGNLLFFKAMPMDSKI